MVPLQHPVSYSTAHEIPHTLKGFTSLCVLHNDESLFNVGGLISEPNIYIYIYLYVVHTHTVYIIDHIISVVICNNTVLLQCVHTMYLCLG